MSPSDFVFGSVLGQGSFAKVYHAQFKKTKANFAVKVMDQEFIKKHDKVPFVVMERQVMSKLSHPNIVKFYCSFKDDESLYMVMELCRGGELLSYICKERDAAKAQETDFLTFQQILSHDSATMEFPAHVPETARDLIRQLLVLNLDARLIDYDAIQAHPFFTGIDWPNISKATPPVVPEKVDLPTPTMVCNSVTSLSFHERQDGASPNWSLANVLNDVFGATALVADGPTDLHLLRQSNASSSSTCMLENNENILLHGDVKLHGSLFTKKSKELLFTTHGRLVVADPKSPAPSGSFRITDGVHGTQAWCQMLSSFKP
ncbi:hypothetical protein DYB32_001955 [Aphanomyces invadans]|uniref:non-specific serine/threonine protein kinase n=1 Tax=Aphanomyces invadans TaxID=157072 RepID=A0A3R6YDM4_9STRA|nr:hypothetical protein DYB32_001955 [Aphanomyces invadans]